MSQKQPRAEEQDSVLICIFEGTREAKGKQIGGRQVEELDIMGRDGRRCEERQASFMSRSRRREEWSYEQELRMLELHNEVGNKWAGIGRQLGKSDNSVKNRFYSRLRRSLRKMNEAGEAGSRKELRQIKPSLLYRVVEVSEERFKANPAFERAFVCFSTQLKNQLLDFSFHREGEEQPANLDTARVLIQKVSQFGTRYQKKSKKERRVSGYDKELLLSIRSDNPRQSHSDNHQSHEFLRVQDVRQGNSDEMLPRQAKKVRRGSADTAASIGELRKMRTRAAKTQNVGQSHKIVQTCNLEHWAGGQKEGPAFQGNEHIFQLQAEGLQVLEQENHAPHPASLNRQHSQHSRPSEGACEQYRFFEDSLMEMIPELELRFPRGSLCEESFFT